MNLFSTQFVRGARLGGLPATALLLGMLAASAIPAQTRDQRDDPSSRWSPPSTYRFVVDVAVDKATFAGSPPGSVPVRGTPFIVNGTIYPSGTLPSGNAMNDPNAPGGIGTWICSGFHVNSLADLQSGAAQIAIDTIQTFLFNGSDKDAIWTKGLEGNPGIDTHRIILGGTGRFRGASGVVRQENMGTNASQLFNYRLHFEIDWR